jgi:zinc/manganese transport system substrate-binding protein
MRSRRFAHRYLLAVVAGLALTALAACGSSSGAGVSANGLPQGSGTAPNTNGRLGVVASANFWGNIATQIGGDRVAVTSIINDPNTDPHEYEANVNDAAAIAAAKLVIDNGLGYDDFMSRLLAAHTASGRKVLVVADAVGVHGNANPHLWYSPAYVATAARAIEGELAAAEPASAATFAANLNRFLTAEDQVAAEVAKIKAKYAGTAIAYTERVPGYLIQAAGLRLGTPASFSQAVEDGTDPSPIDNAAFEKALTSHTVHVLLYNAQVTDAQTEHLKQLATGSGIPVVGVTETLPAGAKDFQTWQLDQAKALLAALGG